MKRRTRDARDIAWHLAARRIIHGYQLTATTAFELHNRIAEFGRAHSQQPEDTTDE